MRGQTDGDIAAVNETKDCNTVYEGQNDVARIPGELLVAQGHDSLKPRIFLNED